MRSLIGREPAMYFEVEPTTSRCSVRLGVMPPRASLLAVLAAVAAFGIAPALQGSTVAGRPPSGHAQTLGARDASRAAVGAGDEAGLAAGVAPASAASPWRRVEAGLYGDNVGAIEFVGNTTTGARSHAMLSLGASVYRSGADASDWRDSHPNPDRRSQIVAGLELDRGDADRRTLFAGLQSTPRFARSSDGGMTWTTLIGPSGPQRLDVLASSVSGRLYATQAGTAAIWFTDDRGETWTEQRAPVGALSPIQAMVAEPADAVVYLRSESRLYRSDDDPAAWSQILGVGASVPATVTMEVALAATGPRGRLMAAGTDGPATVLAFSKDRGATWRDAEWPAEADPGDAPSAIGLGEVAFGEIGIWIGFESGDVFRSVDNGRSWRRVAQLPAAVTVLAVDPSDYRVLAGTDGFGVFRIDVSPHVHTGARSVDVQAVVAPTWETEDRAWLLARIQPARDDRLGGFANTYSAIFASTDGGETWSRQTVTNALGSELLASRDFLFDRRMYSGRYLSTNAGFTWEHVGAAPGGEPEPIRPHVMAVGPITVSLPTVYGLRTPFTGSAGGDGLYYSQTGGGSWIPSDSTISGIVEVAISPAFRDDGRAFLATDRGIVYRSESALGFSEISRVRVIAGQGAVSDLQISEGFARDGTLAMAVEDDASPLRANVYVSNDGGATWQPRTDGLDPRARPRELTLSPDFGTDRTMLVGMAALNGDGTWPAIYASDNAGLDWFGELELVAPYAIEDLEWAGTRGAGRIFAAAGRAGLWVRDLDGSPMGPVLPTVSPTPSPTTSPTATPSATTTVSATAGATSASSPTAGTPEATPTEDTTPTTPATPAPTSAATATAVASAVPTDVPTGTSTSTATQAASAVPSTTLTSRPTATATRDGSPARIFAPFAARGR